MACDTSVLVAFFFISLLFSSANCSEQLSAYTLLEQFGFPRGLLPTNVQSYTLDDSSGNFAVYLDGSCSFDIEDGYRLKYSNKISGTIRTGSLQKLKGIGVKVLFFWLSIDEVDLDGDHLEFYVGLVSAAFPISNFLECPQCGCGLDCSDRPLRLITGS